MPNAQLLEPGDRVIVLKGHPHASAVAKLIAYETYGMGWKGWRAKREDDGTEFYAKPDGLRVVERRCALS
jgi:hypothetical protein